MVRLDRKWAHRDFPDGELESIKGMLYDQQAACKRYQRSFETGRSMIDRGSYKRAVAHFEAALSRMPASPMDLDLRWSSPESKVRYGFSWTLLVLSVLQNIGDAYALLGMHKKSTECFERSLQISPDDPTVLTNAGRAMHIMEMRKESAAYSERAIRIRPDYDTAVFNKGVALLNMRDYGGALECFDRALKINPDYRKAAYQRKMALRREISTDEYDLQQFMAEQVTYPDIKCHVCKRSFSSNDVVWSPYIMEKDSVLLATEGYGNEILGPEHVTDRNMPCLIWGHIRIEHLGSCPGCGNVIPAWWFGRGTSNFDGHDSYLSPVTDSYFRPDAMPGESDYDEIQGDASADMWQCGRCGRQTHYASTTLYSSISKDVGEILAMLCRCGTETEYPRRHDLFNGIIE